MDYRERKSRARGVYPTHYASRMGAAKVNQEEEADTRKMRKYNNESILSPVKKFINIETVIKNNTNFIIEILGQVVINNKV